MRSLIARAPAQVVGGEAAGGERGRRALEDAERLHAVAVLRSRRPSTPARRRCARTSRAPRPRAGGSPRAPARRSCRARRRSCRARAGSRACTPGGDALLDPAVRRCDLLWVGARSRRRLIVRSRAMRAYRALHSAFIGKRPSTGCPAATCSAIHASSSSWASAASATSSASAGGITMTPSASPTMTSPGCTVVPPHRDRHVDVPRHVPAAEDRGVRARGVDRDADARRRRRSRGRRRR